MSSEPSPDHHRRRIARDRWTIVLASMIVLLQLITLPVVFGMAAERDTGTSGPEGADDSEPTPEIAPQHFSGAEPARTDKFSVEGGLTVFEIEHNRGGNFIAVLEDLDFERVTGLANTIGHFEGSTARHVEAGEYVIAMNGRDWSVTVSQPRYQEGDTPPVSFSGEGFTATDPFEIEPEERPEPEADAESGGEGEGAADDDGPDDAEGDGEDGDGEEGDGETDDGGENGGESVDVRDQRRPVRFAITHEGEGNIRIRLLDQEGRRVAGVLNDRGSVDTVEQDELDPGVYLFDVQTEGDWTIEVEVQ